MILRLVHPGGPRKGPLNEAANDYRRRIGRRFRTDEVYVRAEKLPKGETPALVEQALEAEAGRVVAEVGPNDLLVALAIDGEGWSSEKLARRMDAWQLERHKAVIFALGGPHGLAPRVHAKARLRWSFGPMTLPHDLARVVLWEQLYRATTIIEGRPYHK